MQLKKQVCFPYIDRKDRTVPLRFKPQTISYGYTVLFVPELVGNPKDRFSHDAAHIMQRYMYVHVLTKECGYSLYSYLVKCIVFNSHQIFFAKPEIGKTTL